MAHQYQHSQEAEVNDVRIILSLIILEIDI